MRKKSVKDITVRELSDLDDINRGTFYTHYKDVFDLLDILNKEYFCSFIISGFEGMIQYCLETGLKKTPREMTKL